MNRYFLYLMLTIQSILGLSFSETSVGAPLMSSSSTSLLDTDGGSSWQATLVSFSLGSQFFFGAAGQKWISSRWSLGAKAGSTLDFTRNQSFLSLFGRAHSLSQNIFLETSATQMAGFDSGSRFLGFGLGFRFDISRDWIGEAMVGYEGIDRLFSASFSSWSTARLQVGITRQL